MKTLGERLRYFRETIIKSTINNFVDSLDVSARTLIKYEKNETSPDAQFFTRLNAKYHEVLNLDWLLTGRGAIYSEAAATGPTAALKEQGPGYGPAAIDLATVGQAIQEVAEVFEEEDIHLSPEKFARLIVLYYKGRNTEEGGGPDKDRIMELVRLASP